MSFDWEPSYGFCEFNQTDNEELAAALEIIRRGLCAYRSVGDVGCDCKYGVSKYLDPDKFRAAGSEATGCPELRELINRLLHRPQTLTGDADQEARVQQAFLAGRKSIAHHLNALMKRDETDFMLRYQG